LPEKFSLGVNIISPRKKFALEKFYAGKTLHKKYRTEGNCLRNFYLRKISSRLEKKSPWKNFTHEKKYTEISHAGKFSPEKHNNAS